MGDDSQQGINTTSFDDFRRDHVDLYNNIVDKFQLSHFMLNTGAMSALSVYFVSKAGAPLIIKLAGVSFLMGMFASVFALIMDLFYSYWRLWFFDQYFYRKSSSLRNKNAVYEDFQTYEKNIEDEMGALVKRLINGIVSYILFIFGVMLIVFNYIGFIWSLLTILFVSVYTWYFFSVIQKCYYTMPKQYLDGR